MSKKRNQSLIQR